MGLSPSRGLNAKSFSLFETGAIVSADFFDWTRNAEVVVAKQANERIVGVLVIIIVSLVVLKSKEWRQRLSSWVLMFLVLSTMTSPVILWLWYMRMPTCSFRVLSLITWSAKQADGVNSMDLSDYFRSLFCEKENLPSPGRTITTWSGVIILTTFWIHSWRGQCSGIFQVARPGYR